jgi:hypothetical protein
MNAHRKKKHADSVYPCSVCREGFVVSEGLMFHMRMCHNEVAFEEDVAFPVHVSCDLAA